MFCVGIAGALAVSAYIQKFHKSETDLLFSNIEALADPEQSQINKIPRKKEPIFQGQKIPVFQDHNTQDAPTVQYNWQNIIP